MRSRVLFLLAVACTSGDPDTSKTTLDGFDTDTGPTDTDTDTGPGPTDTGPTDTGPTDTGPGPTDTGPTDTGMGAALITSASVSCDIYERVTLWAETSARVANGLVFSQETGNVDPHWADEHTLYEVDQPTTGSLDLTYAITLDTEAGLNDWVVDQSTVFSCSNHFEANVMSHAFRVYDFGGVLADCLVLGHDPQGLIDNDYARVTDPATPSEIASCRVGALTY